MGGRRRWRVVAGTLGCIVMLWGTAPAAVEAKPPAGKGGKPGYPDRITFSGRSWQVKSSKSAVGPGPNVFSTQNVSVDSNGHLHLEIVQRDDGTWTAAEVIADDSLGYGTYQFSVASPVNDLDPQVVLGMFTWSDKARFAHREIDVEIARWGKPASEDPTNAQFVVQPHDSVGHLSRFTVGSENATTYSFTWAPGRVDFTSSTGSEFTYTGGDVPQAGDETPRINLWLFEGRGPTDGQNIEVVLSNFEFEPLP